MNAREPAQTDLDPALEELMSELDDALFAGRPTEDFEREITERFGESPSQIVSTLKALHSARAASLSHSSSRRSETDAPRDRTQSASAATTFRATSGLAQTVFGRFEIMERLGSGGAGTVFRARDSRLGRLVALKVARAEALFSSEAKQRFIREAQTLAALRHPNIIPIYEFGESGGLPYIVEELCDGPNLAIWLRQKGEAGQQVPIRAAVEWTLQLAEAVAHAHRCGVVHRDLKPSNVLLGPLPEATSRPRARLDGVATERFMPRVTDFGIAKLFGSEEAVTASQAVLGTAAYMAPEQAEGRSREVGPPADVYSLGVVLYELLTGRRPIEGRSDVDTLRRVLTDDPLPLSQSRQDVPRDLEAVCHKCLEKDFAKRYASAAELADDLGRFLNGEPVCARRLHPVARMIRQLRPRHLSWAAVLIGALCVLSLIAPRGLFGWLARYGWLAPMRGGTPTTGRTLDASAIQQQPEPHVSRQAYLNDIHRADLLLRGKETQAVARRAQTSEARRLLSNYIPITDGRDSRRFEWHYLWKIANPRAYSPMFRLVRTVSAHAGAAYFACFSPDGGLLATASADRTARVWDVATGELRLTLEGHTHDVNCVAFAPDGKTLATASEDRTVRLWDASTGALRKIVWEHTCEVVGVAFNPSNGQLACVARDGVLTVWDPASFQPIATITAHAGQRIDELTFSSNGNRLATAGADSTVRLWDSSASYGLVAEYRVPDAQSVGLSHDRQLLAVGHAGGVRVYRIRTGELVSEIPVPGGYVRSVRFTADDSSLLTAGDKQTTCLVDLTTGETWDPFGTSATLWCVVCSPNGRRVATTDSTGKLALWDCSARRDFHRTKLPVPAWSPTAHLAVSPDGGRIAVAADATSEKAGTGKGELAVWDVSHSEPRRVLQSEQAGSRFHDVAFTPDGDAIAYSERPPAKGAVRIRVVDAETGALRFEIAGDAIDLDFLLFSPGGSILVSQERYGSPPHVRIQFRDARTGRHVRTLPVVSHPAPFAISPIENLFATEGTNHDSRIDLYRLPNQQRVATLNGFDEPIHSLIFSKDGRFLVGRGDRGYIAVLERETGTVVRHFTVPGVSSVSGYPLTLSPDGGVLALGSKNAIVLADFESGQSLCSLLFPTEMEGVSPIAFAADGKTVVASGVTAQHHCGVHLWQAN